MVNKEEIERWLDGGAPSRETVDVLAAEAPWWLLPAVSRLRNAGDVSPEERAALLSRLAVAAPDLEQMSMAVNADLSIDLSRFYPIERPSTPDTEGTIEKFLTTYGTTSRTEEELLERLIFNPTPDYAQMLAREEEQSVPQPDDAPAGSPDDLINSFIIKSKASEGRFPATTLKEEPEPQQKPQSPVKKPVVSDDSMLSESLARVYIKQHKYAKAHEIISHLNLNFPQKSIYFADQLRFLEKLIAIEERKTISIAENNNQQ